MARKPSLTTLKNQAKRAGWLKWVRSEADERALLAGCKFDVRLADRPVEFFRRYLRHCEGQQWAGKPFELMDWQRDDVIMPLFGWLQPSEHYGQVIRRYNRTYIEVPKKNGKSPLGAAVGLYMLVGDGEQGAKVFSAAHDRLQAGIVHGHACAMVKASPELRQACKIHESTKVINYPATNSLYRALASEAEGQEGLNANCIVVDELHAWYGRRLWDALKYAFASRMEPLLFVITTSGDDPQSVCYEQYQYAKGILEGTIEDLNFLAYIAEARPNDDFSDPVVQKKANPSLGITISPERFNADLREAQKTPSAWSSFLRYRFNIWATSASPWINIADWNDCRADFAIEDLYGRRCYAGLDLSKTRDTTSLALVFPWDEGKYRILVFFWLPEATADKLNDRVSYRAWADADLITLTPGNVVDYQFVTAKIRWCREVFDLQELAFDRMFAMALVQPLQEEGLACIEFGQSMSDFSGPTTDFERFILERKIEHNGHAVLTWQIGNTQVKSDPVGNMRPIKPKPDDFRKIDGVVASVMGLERALQNQDGGSFYDLPEEEREQYLFV